MSGMRFEDANEMPKSGYRPVESLLAAVVGARLFEASSNALGSRPQIPFANDA